MFPLASFHPAIPNLFSFSSTDSILPTTLSEPLPVAFPVPVQPTSATCPLVQKSYTTVTTVTTLAPPDCPTATSTKVKPCSPGVTPPGCVKAQCIRLATSTVGCPGVCCPKKEPTTTTTYECSTPCVGGCGVFYETSTVGCPTTASVWAATPTA